MKLSETTVIVTGGGRGIGKAVALDLAREKARVVVAARSGKEVEKTVHEIDAAGGQGLGLVLDLSKESDIDTLVDATLSRFGTIDILINNAATLCSHSFLETTAQELDMTLNLNLRSPFLLSQKVMRHMISRKQGHIINIASTAALAASSTAAAYAISKRGLEALTLALRDTGRKYGIRASTLYPGYTDTRMLQEFNVPGVPEKRMLPEDISSCIMFLLRQSDRMEVGEIIARASI